MVGFCLVLVCNPTRFGRCCAAEGVFSFSLCLNLFMTMVDAMVSFAMKWNREDVSVA
jgi:hypothetical protein